MMTPEGWTTTENKWAHKTYSIGQGRHFSGIEEVEWANTTSSILMHEVEGYDQVASVSTADILQTIRALNMSTAVPIGVRTVDFHTKPNQKPNEPLSHADAIGNIFVDLILHNFYFSDFIGNFFISTPNP